MGTLLVLIGTVFALACVIAKIIIFVEAFKDEIWKGIVCLFCDIYQIYYTLFEFDHEYKWQIVGAYLGGGIVGGVLLKLGASMM
jgi:hypothetical protein